MATVSARGGVTARGYRWCWGVLALLALPGLALFVLRYPWGGFAGAALVLLFVGLMSVRRDLWLLWVPALAPVVDMAGWTGQIHLTESDAVFLSAVLVGSVQALLSAQPADEGGRVGHRPRRVWRMGPIQLGLIGLLALSYGLSTQWSAVWTALGDQALWVGYDTALNGPRVAKGFVWALLLLPLLADALRHRQAQAQRWLVWGLVGGGVLVGLAAVWERWVFTGLTNFSSDYRTTALFWEMNVGGAMLDAWLALTVPVALWWALKTRDPRWLAALMLVLGLLAYVSFTTFARGLYLGLVVGGVLLLGMLLREGHWRVSLRGGGLGIVFAAVLAALLTEVFKTGGYRGMGALLGLALAVYGAAPVLAVASRRAVLSGWVLALGGMVFSLMAMWWVPKGVYLAYALNAVLLGALLFTPLPPRFERWAMALVVGLLLWLAGNAVLVSQFWAEQGGVWPALACALWLMLPLAVLRVVPARCWQPSPVGWAGLGIVLGALVVAVLALNTYYATSRMARVAEDLEGRWAHWAYAASLPKGAEAHWLGVGVGRFAEQYFWQAPAGLFPGVHRLTDGAGPVEAGGWLVLGAPRHVLGFGELYRVSQRVSPGLVAPLLLSARLRAPDGDARLVMEVCRKHLLYTEACTGGALNVAAGAGWTTQQLVLGTGGLGGSGGLLPRLTVFSIANESRALLEVDDLSLLDANGRELLANGNFVQGTDFWFFSSDRHHLPWHAKNLWLHYYVEQGWLGLLAFSLLAAAALFRVTVGGAHRHALAPPLAAGLAAFFVVGAFDSLLDAPRLATVTFLLMFTALGLRAPAARTPSS